jgi:acetylglutamate synthase
MSKVDFLPAYMEGVQISQFLIYSWQDQKIKVLPANANNDIKIDYVKELFQNIVDENSPINVINAITALQFRTAGLCAEFIERNITSATSLNQAAELALNRAEGIGIKGKQSIVTRRRPFRSGYKRNRLLT